MPDFTLIVPFYRNCAMLAEQVRMWNEYPRGVRVVVVDDGSPEPARPIILQHIQQDVDVQLYRIEVDIPWNREGARNLGATVCESQWMVHVDIDHVLPPQCAERLLRFDPKPGAFYRFPRWRNGRADETRRKDKIPDEVRFAQIHPHVDSYLIERERYWFIGGYDEDFSGCLGGGSDFLRRVEERARIKLLPEDICLHVYTRDKIKDASDWSLSRDTTEGKQRARKKQQRHQRQRHSAEPVPASHVRFPWQRQL